MEGVLKSYDSISGADDTSTLEPFLPRSSILRRMLSLQLVLFQALPSKIVQYRAICAFMHLQSIGEVFSGCCTSDPALLVEHLDPNANIPVGQKQLSFDTDSLWSLLPLCGWTLDFCTLLFRELAVFLNMRSASTPGSPASDQQSVPDGQSPPAQTEGTPKPNLLCFLYHNRARKALRSVLVVMEQFQQYVKNREQLFVRVYQSQAPVVDAAGPDQEIKSMTVQEAIAMKEIQITHLSQYVEMTFSRCSLRVDFVKSLLRDLISIVNQNVATAGGGVLDKSASDHGIFIKGIIPTLTTKLVAQAKTDLRNMTRRYPTLWNMNKLMFATLHWLELEPTNTLTDTRDSRNRAAAMHPARCRIDPVAALKPRSTPALMAGRHSVAGLPHLPSNVSNASIGSRGSISSATGVRMGVQSKVFSESPGELPLSQQSNQQPRFQSFGDSSSTMATSGSISHGGPFDHHGSSFPFASSLWGLVDDERRYSKNEQGIKKDDEDQETSKPAWQSWSEHGQHQGHRSYPLSNGHGAETVPDDDQQAEEEAEDEDEYMDSDEEMRESSVGGGSRRNSKVGSSLPSSSTTMTPWLLREAKSISKRTRSEWTLLPVLSDERSSPGMERSDTRGGRLAMLGLSGHFAPVDLQPTEFKVFSQSEIEAQVRKRRYGNDPIRKVKKFKAIGSGRQCIR